MDEAVAATDANVEPLGGSPMGEEVIATDANVELRVKLEVVD